MLPRLTSAILLVLYTRTLSLGQYGEYAVLSVLVGFLGIALDLGIPQALLRNYYDAHHNGRAARMYLATIIYSGRIASLALLPILGMALFFSWPILRVVKIHAIEYTILVLAISYFDRTSSILSAAFRALERPFLYAMGPLLGAITTVSGGIILVFLLHKGIAGAMVAMLAGRIASAFTYQLVLRYGIGVRGGIFDWHLLRSNLAFGLPLVPNRFAAWGREAALRPILVHVVRLPLVGLFSFASSLAALPLLLSTAVELVLMPYYFKMRTADVEGFIGRVEAFSTIFIAILAPVWTALVLFTPELVRTFAGVRYEGAIPICSALFCASFIRTQQAFLARQIHFLRQTWIMPAVTLPSAFLSIALAVYLSNNYGVAATGWAVLVADTALYVALAILTNIYERVHHPIVLTLGMTAMLALLASWGELDYSALGLLRSVAERIVVLMAISCTCFGIWIWPNRTFIRNIIQS